MEGHGDPHQNTAKDATGQAAHEIQPTAFLHRPQLDYNSRNGKVELENDRGEVFSSQEEIKEWGSEFSDHKRRQNQRDTMHMVLSMPEGVEPESVKNAVRDFAKAVFGKNHEYVFAPHTD